MGTFDPAVAVGFALVPLFVVFVAGPVAVELAARRRLRGPVLLRGPRVPGPAVVRDVSGPARRRFAAAAARHAGEVLLACTVAFACLPWLWPTGPLVAAEVLLVWCAAALLLRVRRGRRGAARVRVTPSFLALAAVAGCVVLLGLGWIVLGVALEAPRRDDTDRAGSLVYWPRMALGVLVMAGGVALYRLALRRNALPAGAALARDDRPPVVHLRSFGDDDLRIRVASSSRRSLLERLSLRRRLGFEEMVADHVRRHGPVVAIGRPGERLLPLGFARESLDDEAWRPRVAELTGRARLITLVAGEGEGLDWEVRLLARTGALGRAVVVVPPVPAAEVDRRWRRLMWLLAGAGVRPVAPPFGNRCLLAAVFPAPEACVLYTARTPDAWSYGAAIDAAVAELAQD